MIGRSILRLTVLATAMLALGSSPALTGPASFGGQGARGGVRGPAGAAPAGAVVYLVGPGLDGGGVAQSAVLDQRDITFVPHVLTAVAGAPVAIRNGDAILHNVHTRSRMNRPFNKSQLANGSMTVSFDEPEVVRVSCDVHSQMSAFIVVVPNRFFATVAEDGSYEITDVPEGSYELVGWHEDEGETRTTVEVSGGSLTPVTLDFTDAQ